MIAQHSSTYRNAYDRYGRISKVLHWLTALLILILLPLGFFAKRAADQFLLAPETVDITRVTTLFSLHKTLGIALFLVALARIIWASANPKPHLLHGNRKLEAFGAETVHWILYGMLVVVPASGWLHHAASTGFAPIWWPFGQNLPFIPKSDLLSGLFASVHFVSVVTLLVALGLHIAGALKHHFVDRDQTLQRMLPGGAQTLPSETQPRHWPSILAAAAVVCTPVVILTTLLPASPQQAVPLAKSEMLSTELPPWTVEDGSISIEILQLGAQVQGGFNTWNADIAFDPNSTTTEHGHVRVQISIPSLHLGNVTSQAMGPDYFQTDLYPEAQFEGRLVKRENQLFADGTLTIKEHQSDLVFPFSLNVDGNMAAAEAEFVLDRRQFGIGATVPDAATLGFDVIVKFELTARLQDPAQSG